MIHTTHIWIRLSVIAGLCLLLPSCEDTIAPKLPVWDVDLNVPLASESYTMEELLEQDSSLRVSHGDGNILIIGKDFPIQAVALGDKLRLTDRSYAFSRQLGELHYDIPDVLDENLTVGSMFPSLQQGVAVVGPITTTSSVDIAIDARQFFQEMTFESGKAVFTLTNTTSIPLTFPKAGRLLDAQGRELATIDVPVLLHPGEKAQLAPMYLDGVTLTNAMQLSLFIATPGSNSLPVSITGDMGLRIHAAILETRIRSAVASFPPQTIEHSERLDISGDEGTLLQSGLIRSGVLDLTFHNYTGVASSVDMLLESVTIGGQPIRRSAVVGSRGMQTLRVDLGGATIAPESERYLPLALLFSTEDASSRMVLMTSRDSVAVTASLHDVVMDHMTGSIASQSFAIDNSVGVNFSISPSLSGSISYPDIRMWAELRNNSALPLDILDGTVTGRLSGSPLLASLDIPATTVIPRGQTAILFDEGQVQSFFNTFPQQFPDRLGVRGTCVLNRQQAYGTLSAADTLSGTLHIDVPLRVAIDQASYQDTTAIVISESTIQNMDNLQGAVMTLAVENHLPAGFRIETELLDQGYQRVLAPVQADGRPMLVEAAPVNSGGRVLAPATSSIRIQMSGAEVRTLVRSKYMKLHLTMDRSAVSPVVFRSSDYIKVRAYATLTVRADMAAGK